ncbi:hypothetical protein KJ656_00535 [bacterium]|nr:hypothetical protein [bacterium]
MKNTRSAFKALDRIDLSPSPSGSLGTGLVGFCVIYVNRFYRMLFMLIPLRGFRDGMKGSRIVQGFVLRYEPNLDKPEPKRKRVKSEK